MSAAVDAVVVVVGDQVGDDVDRPRALIVPDDEEEGEPGSKRFKGTRKSGRVWKTRQKEPIATVRTGKAFHTNWKEKLAKKAEMEHIREQERQRKQEIEDKNQEIREKRQEKLKRRLANEKRSEVVQPLNPKKLRQKLKTMSKKQLRSIRKTTANPL